MQEKFVILFKTLISSLSDFCCLDIYICDCEIWEKVKKERKYTALSFVLYNHSSHLWQLGTVIQGTVWKRVLITNNVFPEFEYKLTRPKQMLSSFSIHIIKTFYINVTIIILNLGEKFSITVLNTFIIKELINWNKTQCHLSCTSIKTSMKWGHVLLPPLGLPGPLRAGVSGWSGLAWLGVMFPLGQGLYLHWEGWGPMDFSSWEWAGAFPRDLYCQRYSAVWLR